MKIQTLAIFISILAGIITLGQYFGVLNILDLAGSQLPRFNQVILDVEPNVVDDQAEVNLQVGIYDPKRAGEDKCGAVLVYFFLDNQLIQKAYLVADENKLKDGNFIRYSFEMDTTELEPGRHTLTAKLYLGQIASNEIIWYNNLPYKNEQGQWLNAGGYRYCEREIIFKTLDTFDRVPDEYWTKFGSYNFVKQPALVDNYNTFNREISEDIYKPAKNEVVEETEENIIIGDQVIIKKPTFLEQIINYLKNLFHLWES